MSSDSFQVRDALVTVGQVVAERYEITRHLGTGGFAKVFEAHDRVIEREVAIKFLDLRAMHADEATIGTTLERFRREAKLAARIPHRNVVNIFDIGQLDQEGWRPFIVMELLSGHDLEEHLSEHGAMEPARLLPMYVDCLDALGQAHERGIVHKDLKPSNLFYSDPGERSEALRIVDFGIAHIKGSGTEEDEQEEKPGGANRLTATGQILGTLQYLTPEYIGSQLVTPALDVYQMALILVEMLSGERVIKTDNPFECLRIHTFGLLEIPAYLLESSLGPVIERALASEVSERFSNAKVFADALSEIDPRSVPPSPLFRGDPVRTTTFGDSDSSPALPAKGRSSGPSTDAVRVEEPSGPGALRAEIEMARERDVVGRASAAGESARSTVVRESRAASGSGALYLVGGLVLTLVLVAGGVAIALALLGDKPAPATPVAPPPREIPVVLAPAPPALPSRAVEIVSPTQGASIYVGGVRCEAKGGSCFATIKEGAERSPPIRVVADGFHEKLLTSGVDRSDDVLTIALDPIEPPSTEPRPVARPIKRAPKPNKPPVAPPKPKDSMLFVE